MSQNKKKKSQSQDRQHKNKSQGHASSDSFYFPVNKGIFSAVTLISVIVCLFSIPKILYPGDAVAIRREAQAIVTLGQLNVPANVASNFGERGQYFYENGEKQKWYSKWPLMNSLLYVPPLLLEKIFKGEARAESENKGSLLQLLNYYNIFWTVLLIFYLYQACSLFTSNQKAIAGFVLTTLFASFIWNYLRAQAPEIFHMVFFVACFYHLVRFDRLASLANKQKQSFSITHLVSGMIFLSFIVHLRLAYLVVMPFVGMLLLTAGADWSKRLWPQMFDNVKNHFRELALGAALPVFLLAVSVLLVNNYKFGSPFNTGYHQWQDNEGMFGGNMLKGFFGYMFDPQRSIFIHLPLTIFALVSGKEFIKKYRFAVFTILALLVPYLLLVSQLTFWTGEWCYGPRLIIGGLTVLSLPAVLTFENLTKGIKTTKQTFLAFALFLILGFSFLVQLKVNQYNFFTYYRVRSPFKVIQDKNPNQVQVIDEYFSANHWWTIIRDVEDFAYHGQSFPPIKMLQGKLPPETLQYLSTHVATQVSQGNYYWFSK